jgi:purine-nucleoside phosphorylase
MKPRTQEWAKHVIIAPTDPIYSALRRAGQCTGRDRRIDLFRYTLVPGCYGKVALAGPAVGAPAAALLVERLVRDRVKQIVLLGVCGSLTPDLRMGDLFIPTGGISEEGTSRLYREGAIPAPDKSLTAEIKRECRRTGATTQEGKIWTTDAPHRETAEKIKRFRKAGALVVDMEFTALCTVAAFHKISFAALMVVSDERFGPKPTIGFQSPACREGLRLGMETVFHVTV